LIPPIPLRRLRITEHWSQEDESAAEKAKAAMISLQSTMAQHGTTKVGAIIMAFPRSLVASKTLPSSQLF